MTLAVLAAMNRVAAMENEIRRRSEPVEVVVASVPIPAGGEFHAGNLARKTIPASGTGKRNVPAADFELLLGATAKSAIDPGEPVLWTDVEEPFDAEGLSKAVPAGRRALTVTVDMTSSFSGLLQPGDRVDLLAKDSKNRSEWIRDIRVIAMDRNVNRAARSEEAAETGSVTLMVTPAEGAHIADASAGGRLFWFLRNPDDNNALAPSREGGQAGASPSVEIWQGGIRVRRAAANVAGDESPL